MLGIIFALTYHITMLFLWIARSLFPSRTGICSFYLRMRRFHIQMLKYGIRGAKSANRAIMWFLPLVLPSAVLEELDSPAPDTYNPTLRTPGGDVIHRVGHVCHGAQATHVDFKHLNYTGLWRMCESMGVPARLLRHASENTNPKGNLVRQLQTTFAAAMAGGEVQVPYHTNLVQLDAGELDLDHHYKGNLSGTDKYAYPARAVSYTHLTLPTKRIV